MKTGHPDDPLELEKDEKSLGAKLDGKSWTSVGAASPLRSSSRPETLKLPGYYETECCHDEAATSWHHTFLASCCALSMAKIANV